MASTTPGPLAAEMKDTNIDQPSTSQNNSGDHNTNGDNDSSSPSKPKVAFISGPLDPDDAYFNTHYKPHIDKAILSNHNFVIGPVAGIDTMALQYLVSRVSPSRITIYMAHFEYLSARWRDSYIAMGVNVKDVEDAVITQERDAAMTRDSDYDILKYRNEEEAKAKYGLLWREVVTNTELNERRRRGIDSTEYNLGGNVKKVDDGKSDGLKEGGVGKWIKGRFGVS